MPTAPQGLGAFSRPGAIGSRIKSHGSLFRKNVLLRHSLFKEAYVSLVAKLHEAYSKKLLTM
ncbi:hypothetical protein J6TS1_07410 [Siminovitchia terrae]|uniref:Uncharacterized protein n=1 Tax=Siminovitchia terrae TaxID=1914933 RepID=A0ABQ4KTF0_SIMTE|nr:hypothetical protein J6TS1_07410 [Siminovitchia terrae]